MINIDIEIILNENCKKYANIPLNLLYEINQFSYKIFLRIFNKRNNNVFA